MGWSSLGFGEPAGSATAVMVMSVMKSLGLRAKLNAQKCSERVYQLDDTNATQRCNTLIYRNSWFFPVIPVGGMAIAGVSGHRRTPHRIVRFESSPNLRLQDVKLSLPEQ